MLRRRRVIFYRLNPENLSQHGKKNLLGRLLYFFRLQPGKSPDPIKPGKSNLLPRAPIRSIRFSPSERKYIFLHRIISVINQHQRQAIEGKAGDPVAGERTEVAGRQTHGKAKDQGKD